MYQVQPGSAMSFSVMSSVVASFEWQINKAVTRTAEGVASDTLAWTVPNAQGIWEIHLRVFNAEGEAHHEWVVSTLSPAAAPIFFDYFADLKYDSRTEQDPWDRDLPVWTIYPLTAPLADASKGYLRPDETADGTPTSRTDATIPFGTWRFRYRFPDGNTGAWGFNFYHAYQSGVTYNSAFGKCADTHHHCTTPRGLPGGGSFSMDYDGGGWGEDGRWHEVRIIRTPETRLYLYVDDQFEFYVQDHLYDLNPDKIMIMLKRCNGYEMQVDDIEVYQNEYLFPEASIRYAEYISNYYVQNYYNYPEKRWGIVVSGKGVTLSDIANAVGPQYMEVSGNTFVCKADLVFDAGAEVKIENETLKFRSAFDGERHFVVKYGAEVSVINSTLASENDYYYCWNLACSTTHFAATGGQVASGWTEKAIGLWPLNHAGYIRLALKNSVVDHAAHVFFDSPYELEIENTQFNNLSEIDLGNYTVNGSYSTLDRREREWYRGNKSFYLAVDDLNLNAFKINGVSLSGRDNPLNVTLLLNSIRDKLNLYNLDAEGQNLVLKKPLPQQHGQSHSLGLFDIHSVEHQGDGLDCQVGLVNCRFNELKIEPPISTVAADRTWGVLKYYLDIQVVDPHGAPVGGAVVTVSNETDDAGYPAENAAEQWEWWNPDVPEYDPAWGWQKFYLHRHVAQGLKLNSTLTGADGHTPLPSDPSQTLILADYVKDYAGNREFAYTIKAEINGATGIVKGVNPDATWYRSDPNVPVKTIQVILGQESDLRVLSKKETIIYPNPVIRGKSPSEQVTFGNLSHQTRINIYTPGGRRIAELNYLENREGGSVQWDSTKASGGIYIYVLTAPDRIRKGKLCLIK